MEGTPAHPPDHLTKLVAYSHNAVVLRRKPVLGTGVVHLLHGFSPIVGCAEAIIALARKTLGTESADFYKGATGMPPLAGGQ